MLDFHARDLASVSFRTPYASTRADRRNYTDFIALFDLKTLETFLIFEVEVFQVHGNGTTTQHFVLETWVSLIQCVKQFRERQGRFQMFRFLLREGGCGCEVQDGKVLGGALGRHDGLLRL